MTQPTSALRMLTVSALMTGTLLVAACGSPEHQSRTTTTEQTTTSQPPPSVSTTTTTTDQIHQSH